MKDAARRICARRHIEYMEEKLSEFRPVDMSRGVQLGLEDAGEEA